MNNPRITAKERGLLKGAIRRVFSRSELRRQASERGRITYAASDRPKVKKWSRCMECNQPTPTYLCDQDHWEPIIPVEISLEDMTWDQVIDNAFCPLWNLRTICKPCHKIKTQAENKERRRIKAVKNIKYVSK